MIRIKKYVFDLDNTLIYTDYLNNAAYNYSLKCNDLSPINNCKRITREIVFESYPQLNNIQKDKIVKLKQQYFINNLHLTKGNDLLIKMLHFENKDNSILWTSADKTRVAALLDYYDINKLFKNIFFSSKTKVEYDIKKICELHECEEEQLVFYEDDLNVIKELKKLKLNVISL
ncbi:HAD hydrolase-like protein [Clostridium perfringens]